MTGIDLARQLPLVRRLPPEELDALGCERVEFAAGQWLLAPGEPATAVYGLLTGRVKVAQRTDSGSEFCVELLGPGEVVGVLAAVSGRPCAVGALAIDATAAVRLRAEPFRELVRRDPRLTSVVLDLLATRLEHTTTSLLSRQAERAPIRIARVLLDLASRFGVRRGNEIVFTDRLSRGDLAGLAGTTTETAIRVISRWTRGGVLRTAYSRITLLKPEVLARVVETGHDVAW